MPGTTYTPTVSPIGDALIGRTLDGRYRVVRRIADGGMATVYLSVDERLDREVALKVMRPHLVHDESFVTRFRREARSAASLSHPNVVAVYDQGEDEGTVFLAMEYVPGLTLREVLHEEGPLSPRAALDVLEPLLLALAEAHSKGLIHRDVKPENVILNDNGTVKVADFGLARAVSSQTVTSTSGLLLGTVAYLSPEQVERGIADARSDVYAAGLVLFEMLTGTKAFTGDTPIHVAYQHVHGGVPVPSDRVHGVPPALDDLVAVGHRARPRRASDGCRRLPRARPSHPGHPVHHRAGRATRRCRRRGRRLPAHGDRGPARAEPPEAAAAGAGAAGGGLATRSRSEHTTAMTVPPAPLEGVVVTGDDGHPPRRRWWPAIVASALVAATHGVVLRPRAGRHGDRPVGAGTHPGRGGRGRAHGIPRPAGERGVRREGAQGRGPVGAAGTGHRGAPRHRRLARRLHGPRALRGAPRRRHDGRRGERADRGGQPRGRQAHRSLQREGARGAGRLGQARPGCQPEEGHAPSR